MYVDFMGSIPGLLDPVSCIFVQSLLKDAVSSDRVVTPYPIPDTVDEYVQHIKNLTRLGKPIYVLYQFPNEVDHNAGLDFYKSIGISGIITTDDNVAIMAKSKGMYTICSMLKFLTFDDYFTQDLSMYDEVCLSHAFCRGLDAVKLLPKKYNYQILVNNNLCVYNCSNCLIHSKTGKAMCKHLRDTEEKLKKNGCGYNHEDLQYFEPYIKTFKVQGREFETFGIFTHLLRLYGNTDKSEYIDHDMDWFNSAITDGIIDISRAKDYKEI